MSVSSMRILDEIQSHSFDKDIAVVVLFDFLPRTPRVHRPSLLSALTHLAVMERLHCARDRDEITFFSCLFFSRNWGSFVTDNKSPPLLSNNAANVLAYGKRVTTALRRMRELLRSASLIPRVVRPKELSPMEQ